jgi:hypothetical protein
MADKLQSGASCGGSRIVTKKDVPVIFRINGNYLEYSQDEGQTWTAL